jgi:hypothetical protein
MYTEVSGGVGLGDEAHLTTPQFDWSAILPRVGFWYHMLGTTMGTLHLDLTEQFNSAADGDLTVATSTFVSATSTFTAAHVGSTVTISGSANGNDGTYIIATFVNATTVTFTTAPAGTDETGISFVHDLATQDIITALSDNINLWQEQRVNVWPILVGGGSEQLFHVTFRGIDGNGFSGDMAIDDFFVEDGSPQEISVQRPASTEIVSGATDTLSDIEATVATTFTWTIENQGGATNLTVSAIAAAPSGVANCTVTASPVLTPASPVAAGNTATFDIDVTPTALGAYEFTITITNDDADEGTYTIVVQGTALAVLPPVSGGPVTAGVGSVLITEAVNDPGTSGDEYIEMTNVTQSPVDMTGWQFLWYNGGAATTPTQTLNLTTGTLAVGGTWIVCDNTAPTSANPPGDQYIGGNIASLGNAGLVLLDNTGAIVDAVFFGTSNPAGITGPTTIGTEWVGANAAAVGFGNSQKRTGSSDNNDATDWAPSAGDSLNTFNSGLSNVFGPVPGATLGGADPAYTADLFVGDSLAVVFEATDNIPTQVLTTTITVTGGTLTAAQAGFNETLPYAPAGGVSPHTVYLSGVAAMEGTIELTITTSDGTGSDIITYTVTITGIPEMDVTRGASIADGGTDTAAILVAGTDLTYTIDNLGSGTLNLTGTPSVVVTAGTNVASVNVTTVPSTAIAVSGSTTFVVNVTATAAGAYDFTVSIANDDSDENPYNFTVSGNAVANVPPVVTVGTSAWVDATGGLFTLTLNPGDTINDALVATDPTPDNMSLTVTAPGTALTTLTTEPATAGSAAGPLNILWAGTADASNAPGNYDWTVDINDGTSSTVITARIIITDVAPTHALLNATGGDGSTGTPYTASYAVGSTGANSIDLATVTDGNTSQTVTLTGFTQSSGPTGGTGFTFSLSGGSLTVMPAGTLVAGDVGVQVFDATVTDGTTPVVITVSLTVVANVPPAVAVTGSAWVDAGGGLFTLTLNPGDTINDALTATDATPDNMTTTVTAPGTALATLTAEPVSNATPTAGPISLLWTGTADASNTPGNYDWTIDINDGFSSTVITARIIINDVAPTHVIDSATGGNGGTGTPYTASYVVGDLVTVNYDLATIADANTGQTVTISGTTQTSGPTTGSGFTFSLTTGTLSVVPAATLVAGDAGLPQVFDVTITDGTNPVVITVSIQVSTVSGGISFTNTSPLQSGTVGAVYATVTMAATGGTGPYTFAVVSGSLPAGLSLNATSGDITGTPTLAATVAFDIRATDSLNDSGTATFQITINAAGGGGGGGGGGDDDGGCAAGTSSTNVWLALLGLLGLVAVTRQRRSRA